MLLILSEIRDNTKCTRVKPTGMIIRSGYYTLLY